MADRATAEVYEANAAEYRRRRRAYDPERAAHFAVGVAPGGRRLDLGCGPGLYEGLLGRPLLATDVAVAMCVEARAAAPDVPVACHDLEALPFRPASFAGVWAWKCLQHVPLRNLPGALAGVQRVLAEGGRLDLAVFRAEDGGVYEQRTPSDDDFPGRLFSWWEPEPLALLLEGAGFEVDELVISKNTIKVTAMRTRSLPDVVGPGMRLLVSGLNPSLYSRGRRCELRPTGQPVLAGRPRCRDRVGRPRSDPCPRPPRHRLHRPREAGDRRRGRARRQRVPARARSDRPPLQPAARPCRRLPRHHRLAGRDGRPQGNARLAARRGGRRRRLRVAEPERPQCPHQRRGPRRPPPHRGVRPAVVGWQTQPSVVDVPLPLLRTHALTLTYPGGTTALHDLSIEVPRGSVGLVGANGAGKTTLLRLALGLLNPTSGSIEVTGIAVADDPVGVRTSLGFMPEHDCLPLDQTAADVVSSFGELAGLPVRDARQRASEVLDLVGLDEARFRPIGGFSTGMRQRTKLAQAIVADPQLVLLDEPTAGLDPLGREEMLALLGRLAGFGISVLIATHLLDDVQRVCDSVVMIDGGHLLHAGPTAALLERTGTVRVELDGGAPALVAALAAVGVPATALDEATVDVATDDPASLDAVRDAIDDLGLSLHALVEPSPLPRRALPRGGATVTEATGAVYDRGYRPFDGDLGGRWDSRWALWRQSVRRALGLRRSWRQKIFPWTLLAIAIIPAIVNVGIKYLTRNTFDPDFQDISFITYRGYIGTPQALLLFIAITAPDVICPDRRNRVLPLIFARPLTGTDYVLTKVAAIAAIVFGFGFIPHVVLFVGQMLVDADGALAYARRDAEALWQVPVSVAAVALYYSSLAVALAATTTRRVVAAVAILALLLVTSTVAAIADGIADTNTMWSIVNVLRLPIHLKDMIFLGEIDPQSSLGGVAGAGLAVVVGYLVVVGASLGFLVRRYREVQL